MILTRTLQAARKKSMPESKPNLYGVFAEGLEHYNVVSPFRERGSFVYRPPLVECEINQKSRDVGSPSGSQDEDEDIDIDTMKKEQGVRERRANEQIARYHAMNALFASSIPGYL